MTLQEVENELSDMLKMGHYIKFETYCWIRNILEEEKKKIENKNSITR